MNSLDRCYLQLGLKSTLSLQIVGSSRSSLVYHFYIDWICKGTVGVLYLFNLLILTSAGYFRAHLGTNSMFKKVVKPRGFRV